VTSVRIVSLVPSATETLLALGAEVIACTRFCEQPTIAQVGGTKNPDIDAIASLGPDVVVLDREENRLEDHDALVARGITVHVSDVTSIVDALALVEDLRALVGSAEPLPPVPAPAEGPRRSAFVPIWRRPWMSIGAGTYGASVLHHVGIDLVTAHAGRYPIVELDDVAAAAPDLVLIPSEPYDFAETHLAEIRSAMPEARIARVDGRDLFWWGIRTPEAIARLLAATSAW
jgi:ABC-type Fe3+-hydroxamate transport system substrate-binding protein